MTHVRRREGRQEPTERSTASALPAGHLPGQPGSGDPRTVQVSCVGSPEVRVWTRRPHSSGRAVRGAWLGVATRARGRSEPLSRRARVTGCGRSPGLPVSRPLLRAHVFVPCPAPVYPGNPRGWRAVGLRLVAGAVQFGLTSPTRGHGRGTSSPVCDRCAGCLGPLRPHHTHTFGASGGFWMGRRGLLPGPGNPLATSGRCPPCLASLSAVPTGLREPGGCGRK